jgi:hypothetical protein
VSPNKKEQIISSSIHYKAKSDYLKMVLVRAVEDIDPRLQVSQRKRVLAAVGFV